LVTIQVLGLQIAVDDASLVGATETFGNLRGDRENSLYGERTSKK